LFKTTDAGKTWKPVLQAAGPNGARTGCPDVIMDPANPEILYATLYARQRTPWSFTYGVSATNGEDVGGIFKSTNGGGTWKKLGGGLPGQTGRIGLAISASNPKIVMATVQSDEGGPSDIRDIHSRAGGIFRSEDGGERWTRMSDINPRPFYFSEIKIDPANDQRVTCSDLRCSSRTTPAAPSVKIIRRRCIPIATRSPFNRTASCRRSREPEDKNKPTKPQVRSACC
jgi:hypothetical protein